MYGGLQRPDRSCRELQGPAVAGCRNYTHQLSNIRGPVSGCRCYRHLHETGKPDDNPSSVLGRGAHLESQVRAASGRLMDLTTSATDVKNSGLHHVKRTVRCDPYSGDLDIYKHGFLKVSGNGRYLTYADETPFFYLGDTHWILSHERFDKSNAPSVASELNIQLTSASPRDLRFSNPSLVGQARSAQIRVKEEGKCR